MFYLSMVNWGDVSSKFIFCYDGDWWTCYWKLSYNVNIFWLILHHCTFVYHIASLAYNLWTYPKKKKERKKNNEKNKNNYLVLRKPEKEEKFLSY